MPPVIKTSLLFYCRGCWDKKGKKIQGRLIKRKIYNFSTSVKVQPTLPSVQHSPSDFGMTMTQNGPSVPPSHLSHNTLSQIVHDVFLPPMDRNAIESYMAVSAVQDEDAFPLNNDINNSDDEDDNDPAPPPPSFHEIINLNEREDAFQSHTKLPPPHHLLAELELMNLMARHKLSLNTFKSIFQWAKKSQMRPGFDFCDAKIRSRKAIFDNLQSNLGLSDMKFHPHILNWLPDN
eukprot:jgi/Psemu1/4425/gm1.4425_g